jgi:uncharacterized membrane protein
MIWYLSSVFVHVMCSILWVGWVLFWLLIARPIERRLEGAESARVLGSVNRAQWPPRAIPVPFRLTLPQVAWGLLLLLAASGTVMLVHRSAPPEGAFFGRLPPGPFGPILAAKLVVVGAVVILHVRLARRPGSGAVLATALAAVTLVVLSAALARAVLP